MNSLKPLSSHFEDLRQTLLKVVVVVILGVLLSWIYSKELFSFLLLDPNIKLIAISPLEGFFVSFKLSFYSGILLTSPAWLYLLLTFFIPGLTLRERKLIVPLLFSLYVCGTAALFASLRTIIPLASVFFADYNSFYAENLWSLSSYMSFVISLSCSLLLGSQLLGVLFLLIHYGFLKGEWLITYRKKAYVGAFFLGALLTPPDVPSQIVMAVILITFYELFVLYARLKK